MPRKPSINAVAITIKVSQTIINDAEEAAKAFPDSEHANITRTDMLRIALRRGLDVILAQQRNPASSTLPRRKNKSRES